ncbi:MULTISPECIES: DUF2177 family protein [unclassified Rhizobacter]|uniref:DUF2177 family protein n=1 Tax=unclassified Rhizobacter TaxID=2640088 RepID=UPI0006F538B3|nr:MULTISPECIES: DUF2177 family protein [unclassified Rhizobacter]KQU80982.1 hypothetical protein ASC88_15745 [Rhizobacter sp. Root29]KQW04526.1 hypothetical protein ASC98_05435 [Rhizobacter sp. Root1238]KRB06368.1 hypothetical protein ASE08_11990 [Rhizobacter sp. Root16D2]
MRTYLVPYVAALVVLLALDGLWLGLIAMDWYRAGIGHLMAQQVNVVAAGLFYLLFPVGIVVFAVMPARDAWHAARLGGLLGLLCYATYDLTNLATLRGWPVGITAVDMGWGALVGALSAGVARLCSMRPG